MAKRGTRAMAAHPETAWDRLNQKIIACDRCPRLRAHCAQVAAEKRKAFLDWHYWGRPVPNFGDPQARLLIVGLAPAAHGANRTGRVFTGDRSGEWLFRALHKAGFANQGRAVSADDGLKLSDCAITAACHCAPPANKPSAGEIANCLEWLQAAIDMLPVKVLLALGQIGWQSVLAEVRRRRWLVGEPPKFVHGQLVSLSQQRWLLGSYHPSQQNTFTGVLTRPMLDSVFVTARRLLDGSTSRDAVPPARGINA